MITQLGVRLSAEVGGFVSQMRGAAQATDEVGRAADKMGDQVDRAAKRSKSLGDAAKGVADELKPAAVALTAMGAAAGKFALDFDDAITRASSLAGLAAEDVGRVRDALLELAGATGRGPQEIAEGFYFVSSAGFDTAQSLEIVKVAAQGAAVGLGTTEQVANAVTAAMAAYASQNLTAAQAMDVLTASAQQGKVEASELAAQFGNLLPLASTLGVSFGDLGGFMAYLSRTSGDASRSATQFTGIMVKVLKPTVQGRDALRELGTSAEALQAVFASGGLAAGIEEIERLASLDPSFLGRFFEDQEAFIALTQTLADETGSLNAILDETNNATGDFGEALGKALGSDATKARQALADLTASAIRFGEIILPMAVAVAEKVAAMAGILADLPGPMRAILVGAGVFTVVGVAAVAAAVKITALATSMRVLATTSPGVVSGMGAAATALGSLTAGLVLYNVAFKQFDDNNRDRIKSFDDFVNVVADGGGRITDAVKVAAAQFLEMSGFADDFRRAGVTMDDYFAAIERGIPAEVELLDRIAEVNDLTGAQRVALGGLGKGFADGRQKAADFQATLGETGTRLQEGAAAAQNLTGGLDAAGNAADGTAGNVDAAGNSASMAADAFAELARQVTAAFNARGAGARAARDTAQAERAVAEAQEAVATGGRAAGAGGRAAASGTREAGDAALEAERNLRAYEDALRGVEDASLSAEEAFRGIAEAELAAEDAARGVVDADRGVVEAHRRVEEANRRVASSNRDVEDAQEGVARASQSIIDAQERVAEAQRNAVEKASDLATAQRDLQRVLNGVGENDPAALDAQDKVGDLDRRRRGEALALADAQDRLAEAQERLNDITAFYPEATEEIAKANRDVQKAQLDLEDTQDRAKDTARDLAEAQQDLADTVGGAAPGSAKAKAAQEEVTKALDAQRKSARDLSDAIAAVAERHGDLEDANLRVEESHLRVEEAVRGVEDANRNVEDAERAVIEAHRTVESSSRAIEEAHRRHERALRGVEDANFRVREAEAARSRGLGGGGGGGGVGGAVRDAIELEEDLAEAIASVEEKYRDQIIAAGDTAVALAGPLATEEEKAKLRLEAMRKEYEKLKSTAIPEARGELREFARELGLIPADKKTKLAIDARDAADKLAAYVDILDAWAGTPLVGMIPGVDRIIAAVRNRLTALRLQAIVATVQAALPFAEGGFHDAPHVAQIAPAGAMRLWAEPETGGEAYIPLAPSKRARSREILKETAWRLGVPMPMANGGVLAWGGSVARAGMGTNDGLAELRAIRRAIESNPTHLDALASFPGAVFRDGVDVQQALGAVAFRVGL